MADEKDNKNASDFEETKEDVQEEIEEMEEILPPSDDMRERRYLWIARVFAIFSAVSLCTNLILLVAIQNLVPLNRVEPFYVTFQNKNDQIVRVEKLEISEDIYRILGESLVREYVEIRNTVLADEDEMNRRWNSDGPLRWMSTLDVYDTFSSRTKNVLFEKMKNESYTQSTVINIINYNKDQNNWDVEYTVAAMTGEGVAPLFERQKATIEIDYRQNRDIVYAERIKNPLGFMVKGYRTERKLEGRDSGIKKR